MAYEDETYGWFRLHEPPSGVTSAKQEAAIRAYALTQGYENLRGFHSYLKMIGFDYYEVLREFDT